MTHGDPGPAQTILDGADAAVRAGELITDPIQRAEAFENAMHNTRTAVISKLAAARRAALAEARAAKSVQQIADELGLTRGRVYQILDGKDAAL